MSLALFLLRYLFDGFLGCVVLGRLHGYSVTSKGLLGKMGWCLHAVRASRLFVGTVGDSRVLSLHYWPCFGINAAKGCSFFELSFMHFPSQL